MANLQDLDNNSETLKVLDAFINGWMGVMRK